MADDFIWGRHHRVYISRLDAACNLPSRELAARCGYSDVAKFQRRRQQWRQGRAAGKGHVPIAYLTAIGTDLHELAQHIEKDRAEYLVALEAIEAPTSFTVYGQLPGFSVREPLPGGIEIADAILYIQQLLDRGVFPPGKAMLHWPSLKTVFICKLRPPSERIWPPKLLALSDSVDFGNPPKHEQSIHAHFATLA